MVQPVSITHQFNGDATADAMVNAAALDTALGNLANTQNAEMAERKRIIQDGGQLAQQCVRNVNLHPEVLSILAGIIPLAAVAIVVTTNVALTGLQIIDGYQMLAGDRVLLVNQNNSFQNGVWLAAAGAWARSTDFVTGSTVAAKSALTSLNGTAGRGTQWMLTLAAAVDLASQVWVQISCPASWLMAGSGLTTVGLAAAVDVDGTSIEIDAGTGKVQVKNGGITSAKIGAGAVLTAAIGALQVTAATIAANTITNAKLATMAAATIKGSVAGGTPADLTATQVTALLNLAAVGLKGLCPALPTPSGLFLRDDGTWASTADATPSASPQHIIKFTSSDNWVVPVGVTAIRIRAWGGGGGGGNGYANALAGNGGGGGAYIEVAVNGNSSIAVVPGDTLAIVVGTGGASDAQGITTTVKKGLAIIAQAGGGINGCGGNGHAGSSAGGTATSSITDPATPPHSAAWFGISGQTGGIYAVAAGGAARSGCGGSSPQGGAGGSMVETASAGITGIAGVAPGGGGSGGVNNAAGGAGADGMVLIEY